MAKRYLNQVEAGDLYGCKRQTVGAAMKKGKALYAATVKRDGVRLVDIKHPAAKAYRAGHRVTNSRATARTIDTPAPSRMTANDVEEDIRAYWDWTLKQIFQKCGTLAAFAQLLTAAHKIESIHAQRLDSNKKTGDLISRDYVSRNVFGLIEAVFQRLLTEAPVRLSLEVHGRCETGATLEEIQQVIKDAIARELKTIKRDATKAIKDASE